MAELQELRRYRRDLHRIPELDFDLPQTIAYIEGVLAPLDCELTHPCPSCVCAFFDAGVGAAHATAIRADMDALPIAEATGAAFASTHPGKMHACGHDGHMAMALSAATFVDRTIREQPGAIKRNVLFVFQPAEETTGGAKTVCESGVFERYGVDRIFGFHVWPDLPAGTLASCSVRVRHTFISMARASISLRPMAFRSRSRTMRRWPLPSVEETCRDARRVAVMENIVDHTNVGALMRSAAALDVDAVLVTPSCGDPLYRRAARVSMGTVFQIPWTRIGGDDKHFWPRRGLEELRSLGFTTVAMALSDDSISLDELTRRLNNSPESADHIDKLALIFGTEGDGLSRHTIAGADLTVKIPMSHGVDSLNVAASSAVAFYATSPKRAEQ